MCVKKFTSNNKLFLNNRLKVTLFEARLLYFLLCKCMSLVTSTGVLLVDW